MNNLYVSSVAIPGGRTHPQYPPTPIRALFNSANTAYVFMSPRLQKEAIAALDMVVEEGQGLAGFECFHPETDFTQLD